MYLISLYHGLREYSPHGGGKKRKLDGTGVNLRSVKASICYTVSSAGKMNQILRSDWLSERVALRYFVHSRLPALLYIELAISFLIGRKRTVNFRNQRLRLHNWRLYDNHVKDTQGHG